MNHRKEMQHYQVISFSKQEAHAELLSVDAIQLPFLRSTTAHMRSHPNNNAGSSLLDGLMATYMSTWSPSKFISHLMLWRLCISSIPVSYP